MLRSRFHQVSVRNRFLLRWITLLVLLGVLGVYAFVAMQTSYQSIRDSASGDVSSAVLITHLEASAQQAGAAADSYFVTGDSAERERFNALTNQIDANFKLVLDHARDEGAAEALGTLAFREWEQVKASNWKLMDIPFGHQTSAPDIQEINRNLGQMTDWLEQMLAAEQAEVDQRLDEAHTANQHLLLIWLITFGVTLTMAFLSTISLDRAVLDPVRQLQEASARLMKGELSHRIPLARDDEVGQVTRTFNAMAEGLEQSLKALEELSVRDALTGLFNRRAFQDQLALEIDRSLRHDIPFSLLLLDIDFFKGINDTYGHPVGDSVLVAVAKLVERKVRQADLVTRYGGEELAVILPKTDRTGAVALAERVRAAVAESLIPVAKGEQVRLTVSIGVATFPIHGTNADTLIRTADLALYRAKEDGRNRVRCAPVLADSASAVP